MAGRQSLRRKLGVLGGDANNRWVDRRQAGLRGLGDDSQGPQTSTLDWHQQQKSRRRCFSAALSWTFVVVVLEEESTEGLTWFVTDSACRPCRMIVAEKSLACPIKSNDNTKRKGALPDRSRTAETMNSTSLGVYSSRKSKGLLLSGTKRESELPMC